MFDVKFTGKIEDGQEFVGGMRLNVQNDRESRDVKVIALIANRTEPVVEEILRPGDSIDRQILKGSVAIISSEGNGTGIKYQISFIEESVIDNRYRIFRVSGGNPSDGLVATANNALDRSYDTVEIEMDNVSHIVNPKAKTTVDSNAKSDLVVLFKANAAAKDVYYAIQATFFKS